MLKEIKDIINKQLLRQKPTSEQFDAFLQALRNLKESIQPNGTEEHNKSYIETFLKEAFYGRTNLVNTAGSIDCAIYQTNEATSPIEVILEAKAPNNQSDFPSLTNLNCEAMHLRNSVSIIFLRLSTLWASRKSARPFPNGHCKVRILPKAHKSI